MNRHAMKNTIKLPTALQLAPLASLNSFIDGHAGIITLPGIGRRGWPEGQGYGTSQPQIQRLQIDNVVAGGLEQGLDHQAGTIESLDLRELSITAATKTVHLGGEAKAGKTLK